MRSLVFTKLLYYLLVYLCPYHSSEPYQYKPISVHDKCVLTMHDSVLFLSNPM